MSSSVIYSFGNTTLIFYLYRMPVPNQTDVVPFFIPQKMEHRANSIKSAGVL